MVVNVLIDSSSTHSFINKKLAKKVGLKPQSGGNLEVMVPSGKKLVNPGKCTNVQLNLQGFHIYIDFYLLPLRGYDVVLEAQWLSTLEPIVWDFSKLQMKFFLEDKEVALQWLTIADDKVFDVSEFEQVARKKKVGILLYSSSI